MYAARFNRLSVVDLLLNASTIEVDLRRMNGYTALHIAAANGHSQVVKKLLNAGSDVNAQNEDKQTALMRAASWGLNEASKELLASNSIDLSIQDKDGKTALMWAAQAGSVKVTRNIRSKGPEQINAKDKEKRTALMYAAETGEAEVVRELARWPELDINATDKDGRSALYRACLGGWFETVKILLNASADVDVRDKDSRNAIMAAALTGHRQVLQVLRIVLPFKTFEKAAFEAVDKDGNNAVGLAAQHGHANLLPEFLLVRRNSLGKNSAGETPLFLAAKFGQLDMVKEFVNLLPKIELDSQVNAVDNVGDNALMAAIRAGQLETAQFFLENGTTEFDLGHRNKADWTILHHAVNSSLNKRQLTELLLAHRSDLLNLETKDHRTALQMAIEQERIGLVNLLLKRNASTARPSNQGNSALRTALDKGSYILTNLLLDAHAKVRKDIDADDLEGHRLAVWMGVTYNLKRVIYDYVHHTKDFKWRQLWEKPKNFPGDLGSLEDAGPDLHLISFSETADMVHLLLQWLQRDENVNDWNTTEKTTEVDESLTAALRTCHWVCANALAARGFARKEFQVPAPNMSSTLCSKNAKAAKKGKKFEKRKEGWNRLHFSAHYCDTVATSITFAITESENLARMLSQTDEVGRTPITIAKEKMDECPGIFGTMNQLQVLLDNQEKHQVFAGSAALVAGSCTLFLNTCILRLETLLQKGWCFTAVIPLLHLLAGIGIAFAYKDAKSNLGEQSVLVYIGLATAASAVGLLTLLTATFLSANVAAKMKMIKKFGADKLERCWQKLDFGIAVALLLGLFVKDMTVGSQPVGLSLGIVHAVACYFPLRAGAPKRTPVTLRLIAGAIALGRALFSYLSRYRLPSPATVLMGEVCLCLAWADLPGVVRSAAKTVEIELANTRKSGKFGTNKLVLGRGAVAAQGIEESLGLSPEDIAEGLKDPIAAMKYEVWTSGDEDDRENFRYIVNGTSGQRLIPSAVLTALETGFYHGGELGANDFDTDHGGRTLDDWMKLPEVALSKLTKGEFVAVRFYTSSSFRGINGPLRQEVRPHPWAMVVYLLDRGIKKLRSFQAEVNPHKFAGKTTLWRGLKNLEVDIQELRAVGGTEVAPMSTTTNEDVARSYSNSQAPVLFKFVVSGLRTGVSIRFLSLFPKEEEFLYAPLTFLSLKRYYEDDGTTILVVEPVMS